MTCVWSIVSFSFYISKYQIKHLAGDIFVNSLTSSLADVIARPIGLWFYKRMNAKPAMTSLFAIAAIGSFPIIFSEVASDGYRTYFVPICLFVMGTGMTATFGVLYIGHMDLFPIVFSTTSMGLCNIMARFLTIFAPIVAEIDEPVPATIFTILCCVAIVITLFIRKKTDKFY